MTMTLTTLKHQVRFPPSDGRLSMLETDGIDERGRRRYQHRLDSHGKPLHYVAIVGVKRST